MDQMLVSREKCVTFYPQSADLILSEIIPVCLHGDLCVKVSCHIPEMPCIPAEHTGYTGVFVVPLENHILTSPDGLKNSFSSSLTINAL